MDESSDGLLIAWRFYDGAELFLHAVASPFHSFVTSCLLAVVASLLRIDRIHHHHPSQVHNAQ